jgi:hypothetical protein
MADIRDSKSTYEELEQKVDNLDTNLIEKDVWLRQEIEEKMINIDLHQEKIENYNEKIKRKNNVLKKIANDNLNISEIKIIANDELSRG